MIYSIKNQVGEKMLNKYKTNFRDFIVGADTKIPLPNGKVVTAINFDNAATTPPFTSVMNTLNNFAPWYSSIHRGTGYKSVYSSDLYDKSREVVCNFVQADMDRDTVIYVKNTTEAINKLSNRLCSLDKKCVILSTSMEHHSNDLPWRHKFRVDYIEIDAQGKLRISDLEKKLNKYKGCVRLVAVTGASNVTGYINPIHEIAEIVHKYKAKILVDGAQLVPHVSIDMKPHDSPAHIDYLVFSAHKMYAPFGAGVLIGPKETFQKGEPDYKGGGTVDIVTHDTVKWAVAPDKDEAGTPNIMGVVALTQAIQTLRKIGMDNLEKYERSLLEYALHKLKDIPSINRYGISEKCEERVAIVPFNIEGIPHQIVAKALSDEAGIAVRNGCFCAQPYVQRILDIPRNEIKKYMKYPELRRPGMVRVSFGLYNNYDEIDTLSAVLLHIAENKDSYIAKYKELL